MLAAHCDLASLRYTLLMQNQPVTVHMVYLEVPRPDGSIAPIVPDTWLVRAEFAFCSCLRGHCHPTHTYESMPPWTDVQSC